MALSAVAAAGGGAMPDHESVSGEEGEGLGAEGSCWELALWRRGVSTDGPRLAR